MSGENPILLLKSAITHSIAPRHTQTLMRGRKKPWFLTPLLANKLGAARLCPRRPLTDLLAMEVLWMPVLPFERCRRECPPGWGGGGGRRPHPCWGSDWAMGHPGTDCNKHKSSKTVVV